MPLLLNSPFLPSLPTPPLVPLSPEEKRRFEELKKRLIKK